ncbi:MAG: hypothetical protein NC311_18710 [Muribaculaceae bacterium]|nr:hypothetical protein [Muribaculaceae bacterium]
MSILTDIYNDEYHPQDTRPILPQDLREKDLAFWEKASEVLGREFVDAHLYRLCEIEHFNDYHHFREGFRLGVLLMLEVMGPK